MVGDPAPREVNSSDSGASREDLRKGFHLLTGRSNREHRWSEVGI